MSCLGLVDCLQDSLERLKDFPPIFPVPVVIFSPLQGLKVFPEGGKASRALCGEFVLLLCQQPQSRADLFPQLYAVQSCNIVSSANKEQILKCVRTNQFVRVLLSLQIGEAEVSSLAQSLYNKMKGNAHVSRFTVGTERWVLAPFESRQDLCTQCFIL